MGLGARFRLRLGGRIGSPLFLLLIFVFVLIPFIILILIVILIWPCLLIRPPLRILRRISEGPQLPISSSLLAGGLLCLSRR